MGSVANMSAKFKAIKILESYSPAQFADFVSKNGFPECNEYIAKNKITYSDFKGIYKYHLKSLWETSIEFADFNDFCKFQEKVQTSPEAFFDDINKVIKYNLDQKYAASKINVVNKPTVATKPIGVIKPGLPHKASNVSPKNTSAPKPTGHIRSNSLDALDISNTTPTKSHIHKVQSQISEELKAKLNVKVPKNIPRPPKSVNLTSVPPLPDFIFYKSNPASRHGSLGDIFDGDADEDDENDYEQPLYNELPEADVAKDNGSTENEEDTYCEPEEIVQPEEQHSPHPAPSHMKTPPKLDRQRMPKPPIHAPQQNQQPSRIIAQNSVGDEDDDDDVHLYEELPPSPQRGQVRPGPHVKENTCTMDPTQKQHVVNRAAGSYDDSDYLEPTRLIQPAAPSMEQYRPLPPTPEQEYTLDHLQSETYFRDINRQCAEKLLQMEPIGAFLVRPSKKYFCSFTIKSASKMIHLGTVKLEGNKFHLDGNCDVTLPFHSITDMINFYIENGVNIQNGGRVTHVNLLNIMKPSR